MASLRRDRKHWALPVVLSVYSAGLACGSLLPDREASWGSALRWEGWANVLHVPAYCVLALLWMRLLGQAGLRRPVLAGVGAAMAFGVLMEAGNASSRAGMPPCPTWRSTRSA